MRADGGRGCRTTSGAGGAGPDPRRGQGASIVAVLHGLYWLTADLAQQAPLLLAVDDLHWAHQPRQRLTADLARRLDGLAVLLMLTVREPRAGTAREVADHALATEASVTALRPAALGAAACAELVGGSSASIESPAFEDACRELTGAPATAAGAAGRPGRRGREGNWRRGPRLRRLAPGSVSRSVLVQLGRMPTAALAAARAVAVLGTAATAERAG